MITQEKLMEYPDGTWIMTDHAAPEYMSELINYGGTIVPRGYAYQLLVKLATAQGHEKPRLLADRWMQGYDLYLKRKVIA